MSKGGCEEAVNKGPGYRDCGWARESHEERTVVALWLNAREAGKEGTVQREHKEATLMHTALLVLAFENVFCKEGQPFGERKMEVRVSQSRRDWCPKNDG